MIDLQGKQMRRDWNSRKGPKPGMQANRKWYAKAYNKGNKESYNDRDSTCKWSTEETVCKLTGLKEGQKNHWELHKWNSQGWQVWVVWRIRRGHLCCAPRWNLGIAGILRHRGMWVFDVCWRYKLCRLVLSRVKQVGAHRNCNLASGTWSTKAEKRKVQRDLMWVICLRRWDVWIIISIDFRSLERRQT